MSCNSFFGNGFLCHGYCKRMIKWKIFDDKRFFITIMQGNVLLIKSIQCGYVESFFEKRMDAIFRCSRFVQTKVKRNIVTKTKHCKVKLIERFIKVWKRLNDSLLTYLFVLNKPFRFYLIFPGHETFVMTGAEQPCISIFFFYCINARGVEDCFWWKRKINKGIRSFHLIIPKRFMIKWFPT